MKQHISCELSQKGKQTFRDARTNNRKGIIVGESRDKSCWRVRWDGNKTNYAYHKDFITLRQKIKFVKINYKKIPKKVFELYNAKPFEIAGVKMRREDGTVWNNISCEDAQKEAQRLGYRLPTINEMLVLLHAYKKKYPTNADARHDEFLGIRELSYKENVWIELFTVNPWIAGLRGGNWSNGSYAGAFTLNLNYSVSGTSDIVGFRCVREIQK